jgi:hypothetical protein
VVPASRSPFRPAGAFPAGPFAAEGAALPEELLIWLARVLGAKDHRRAANEGAAPGLAGALPADGAAAHIAARHAARNAVLRALAQRFFPGVPVSIQAALIAVRAERYAQAQWPRYRDRARIPARDRHTPDEYLWAAFKSGAPMPLGKRDLRRILIGLPEIEADPETTDEGA